MPPGLERQLRRLEMIGNAEADLAREEQRALGAGTRPYPAKGSAATKERSVRAHVARTERLRVDRESARVRSMGLVLLFLSPCFTAAYILCGYLHRDALAVVMILLAGLCIGLALPALYFANERQQRVREEMNRN